MPRSDVPSARFASEIATLQTRRPADKFTSAVARKSPSIGAKGQPGAADRGRLVAALRLFVAVALIGIGFALAASYIDFRLDDSAGEYVSFCNINESVNCDTVLSSRFSKILDVPVAWLGVAAHAVLALLGLAALGVGAAAQRPRLQLLMLAALGSAIFSGYMAFVSFAVLGTACLMCIGLYATAAVELGLALAIAARAATLDGRPLFPARVLLLAAAMMFFAVAAAGRYFWASNAGSGDLADASLDELRERDPKFFDWYLAQPVADSRRDTASGKVVIVEFSDFQCGYCKRNHYLVAELQARHPNGVAVIHRNFPLDPACNEGVEHVMHPQACRAAEAAECAGAQGRYEEMARVLFDNQERLFETNLAHLAERAGVEPAAFDACMQSRQSLPKIVSDSREGKRLEITSTPTLFINGRRIRGTFDAPDKYDLALAIERRIAAGDPAPEGTSDLAAPQ